MVILNAGNVKTEDDISGRSRPAKGRYHVAIGLCEEKSSKAKGTPGLSVEFQVLTGTTAGQQGKTMPLFLSFVSEKGEEATKSCLDRVTRFALCAGVLQAGQVAEPVWDDAVGRELVIEIQESEFEDRNGQTKQGTDIAYMGFWSLGNPAVADVPKDTTSPGMLALAKAGGPVNHTGGNGNGNGNGNGTKTAAATAQPQTTAAQTATVPQPPTTAAGKPKSKWADL